MADTETTPLLPSPPPVSPLNKKSSRISFFLTLTILFLIQTGSAIALPATTALLEDIICQNHYARQNVLGVDPKCKTEPVQGSLAMMRGLLNFLLLLPGLVLGVPYAALAEKWGLKRMILFCLAGIFLAEFWLDLVCWMGGAWPVEVAYLAPVFYLLGGGPSVGGSLLFVLVADEAEERDRPTRFFLMEAAGYLGTMIGFIAPGFITFRSPRTAMVIGLAMIFASFVLVVLVPVQHEPKAELVPDGDTEPTLSTVRKAMVLLKGQGSPVLLLVGSLLRALADSVMSILLPYATKLFSWTYPHAGYLESLSSCVHLAVLLLLPALHRLLSQGEVPISKHLALARISSVLSALGSAGMGLSQHPGPFTMSLVVYGLGGGYNQSIRSILTLSTPEEHRAITYTLLGILDSVGVLIGAPLWPVLYRVGLGLQGVWVGLPFLTTAAVLVGVWCLCVKPRACS
ncbi:major facilitator superfamily domain-containing protein [Aspergillus unguis]